MIDSGSATAETQRRAPVAQEQPDDQDGEQPRLRTAAPSSRRSSRSTGSTKLKASVIVMSGCSALSSSSAARTPSATSTSPAPRVRTISKPTTGLPSSSAAERCSATVSLTRRDLVKADAAAVGERDLQRAKLGRGCTVAIVRTDCSAPPRSARPPDGSCCTGAAGARCRRRWRRARTSAPGRARRALRASTPPTRVDRADAGHGEQRLGRPSSSTNHDSASSSSASRRRRRSGSASRRRSTWRSSGRAGRPAGRSARANGVRTSSTASCVGFSSRNSTVIVDRRRPAPWCRCA